MLKVECESCKAPYQVDERRVPATGLKMRCPKCGHTFVVTNDATASGQAAGAGGQAATAAAASNQKRTMLGFDAPPPGTPAAPPVPPPARVPGALLDPLDDPFGELPTVAGSDLPMTKPAKGQPPPLRARPPAPPPARAPAPPPAPPAPPPAAFGAGLDELDLPAIPDALPVAVSRGAAGFPGPKAPAPGFAAAPRAPEAEKKPFEFELDLPTAAADLPAMAKPKMPKGPPIRAKAQPGPPPDQKPTVGEFASPMIDLPSLPMADLPAVPAAGLPMPSQKRGVPPPQFGAPAALAVPAPAAPPPPAFGTLSGGFGELDLPMVPDDLPAVPNNLPAIAQNLPLPKPGGPPPAPRAKMASAPGFGSGFGEIDLPALQNDLPAMQNNLPAMQNNLPAMQNNLPAVQAHDFNLPAVQNNLPAVQNDLPSLQAHDFNLPAVPGHDFSLPAVPGQDFSLPAVVGLDMQLPQVSSLDVPSRGEFGELDLPRVQSLDMQLPQGSVGSFGDLGGFGEIGGGDGGFGELELPVADAPGGGHRSSIPSHDVHAHASFGPPAGVGESAPPPPHPEGTGVGGFGEVDLSVAGSGGSIEVADPGPRTPGSFAQDVEPGPTARTPREDRPAPRKRGKAGLVVLGILSVAIVAGGSLQLTNMGAFGYLAIEDVVHAKDYVQLATDSAAKARTRMALDTYKESRSAVDDLAAVHTKKPRVKPLAAYAALTEFTTELRFGKDPERNTRAKGWLAELPPGADVRFRAVAEAAADAASLDAAGLARARKALEGLARKDMGDPIQQDIAMLRGEVELAAKDGPAAVQAFTKAVQLAANGRSQFGLARAHMLAGDTTKALDAVNKALAASPNDASALVLRAKLTSGGTVDATQPLKDLALVTDGAAKAGASAWEISRAYSERGWILFRRDRVADARASFEQAVKLQAENENALVGQGELLLAEGRYTESLSRYDAALATPSPSVDAILGKAKAQIALERLKEAKEALTAARTTNPREMRVPLWLGKAEEALGNKQAAEKDYTDAVELADPTQTDAIGAYVALASLLATQGRGAEAKTKLEQAKSRLPDSAQLQRAFGQIAAAQGYYDEAVQCYERALQKDPDDLATRLRLGVTLRRMRRVEQAAAELDRVYTVDKEYPGLALERGLLFEETGAVNKALEMFQSALAQTPNDPDNQLRVGAAYVAINRPDDAIPMLKKIVEKRPNSAEAHHYLGRAYLLQGPSMERDAMRELKRAVDLDPNRAEYHLYVAWAANDSTPPIIELVKQEVEKALAIDRLLPEAYWQRGSVERKTALVDDALKDLSRALELRPNLYQAHASMAECYEDKNDEATALVEWQKAIKGDDRPGYWRFKIGRLYFLKNNMAEAATNLAYASDVGEKDTLRPGWLAQAEFMAGEALRKTGKKTEAIERYKRFLELAPLSSPDRRDAYTALTSLGSPVQEQR